MNNALKSMLWSGLVFPGLGQVILKHYTRGIIFILAITAGLVVAIAAAVQQALAILDKIASEGGIITMDTISRAAEQASPSGTRTFSLALLWIIFFWIIATIDAYRVGKKYTDKTRLQQ